MAIPATTLRIGNFLRTQIFCQQQEQVSCNTWTYQVIADQYVQGPTDLDWAVYFEQQMAPLMKAIVAADATFLGVKVSQYNNTDKYYPQTSQTQKGFGTDGPIAMPRQVCGIYSRETAFRGPGFRGRVYLPFPATVDDQSNAVPTAAYVANLTTLAIKAEGMFQFTGTAGGKCVVAPYLVHKNKLIAPTPILGWLVRGKWATQRRRGSYGRSNLDPFQ